MSNEPRHLPRYLDLVNKVAVVTGGSRGIGAATARALAANGVRVAVNGRDQSAIDQTVDDIRSNGGQAVGVAADCTVPTDVERLRKQVEQELGRSTSWPPSPRHADRGAPGREVEPRGSAPEPDRSAGEAAR